VHFTAETGIKACQDDHQTEELRRGTRFCSRNERRAASGGSLSKGSGKREDSFRLEEEGKGAANHV